MGKSLIIKGADFSQNGIVPDYIVLSGLQSIENYRMLNNFEGGTTTPKFHIELTIDYTTITQGGAVLTYCSDNQNGNGLRMSMSKNGDSLIVYYGGNQYGKFTVPINQKFVLDIAASTGIQVDGTTAEQSGTPISSLSAMSHACTQAPMFGGKDGANNKIAVGNNVVFTVHKFVVYADEDDANPIQNWIPVRRTSDNVACMYDTISEVYKEMELVS